MPVRVVDVPQTFRRPAQPPLGFTPLPPISLRFSNGNPVHALGQDKRGIANAEDSVADMIGGGHETIKILVSWPGYYDIGLPAERCETFRLFRADHTPKTRSDLAYELGRMMSKSIHASQPYEIKDREKWGMFEIKSVEHATFFMLKIRLGGIVNTSDGKWHAEIDMLTGLGPVRLEDLLNYVAALPVV